MTERTITNQTDLDTALADDEVTTITIDSPAGVWLNIGDTGGKLVNITGKSTVDIVTGSVGSVGDSGRVGSVGDSGSVGSVGGSGRVGSVGGSGRVEYVGGSGSVGYVGGSGSVEYVGGSGRVEYVGDSGRVEKAAGTAVIQGVYDDAIINAGPHVAVHVYSATATVTGGVLIDLTKLDELSADKWCEHHGIDAARLQAELEHITTHPEEWNQGVWAAKTACGTACCLAGGVVLRAGIPLRWKTDNTADYTERGVEISTEAQRLLGLSYSDAGELFGGGNSLDDLWRIAADVTHGAVKRPVSVAVESV